MQLHATQIRATNSKQWYDLSSVLNREHKVIWRVIPRLFEWSLPCRSCSKIGSEFCSVSVWSELFACVTEVIRVVQAFTTLRSIICLISLNDQLIWCWRKTKATVDKQQQRNILNFTIWNVHGDVPRICPRGGGEVWGGPRVSPSKTENSSDLGHYFLARAPLYEQKKMIFEKVWSGGPPR